MSTSDEERKQRTLDFLSECETAIGKMRAEVEGGGKLQFITLLALTGEHYHSHAISFGPAGAAAHGLQLRTHADKMCERAQAVAQALEQVGSAEDSQ